jgi:transcription elongation factor Elf1
MTGYTIPMTCPRCGGVTTHQDDGGCTAWESWATTACDDCGRSWLVSVGLTEVSAS